MALTYHYGHLFLELDHLAATKLELRVGQGFTERHPALAVESVIGSSCNGLGRADMNRVMDESRFRALFDATYPAMARYARHRGLDRDDAEDLIASTFEVAWRRLDVVPSDDEALLWLYAVAFNLLRNLRRRQGRDRQLVARLPMIDTVLPSSEPSTITTEAIRRALDALSPDDREMILLVAVDELSAAQLGVVFNCSAIAARTRLYRARNRLAELLGFERGVQRLAPSRHEQVENDKPWEALR